VPGRILKRARHLRRKAARRRTELVKRARMEAFDRAGQLTPLLAVDSEDLRFVVDVRDSRIGRTLFAGGARADMHVLDRVLHLLEAHGAPFDRANATFVDIGANIGTTTLAAVGRLGFASAVAVEPAPDNHRLLRVNLAANGLEERVSTHQVALGAEQALVWLQLSPENSGGHRVKPGRRGSGQGNGGVHVQQTTLDALAAAGTLDPERVGLLWMDAEGAEPDVVRGAGSLVGRGVPLVLEVKTTKLRRDGQLDAFGALLREHYTHAVDLGARDDEPVPLGELFARWACADDPGRTDLLVLRR